MYNKMIRKYEDRKVQANKRCLDCGVLIYQYSERCRKCAKKLLKLEDKKCIDCGKIISYGSQGRCNCCASKKNMENPITRKKLSECTTILMKERWKDSDYKTRVSKSLSVAIKEKYLDSGYVERRSIGIHNYLSKMSSKLELNVYEHIKNQGYLNSVRIGKYVVDFINNTNKTIIECYGDYWHCNPKKYSPDYYCKGKRLIAEDIWKSDYNRKLYLESFGYTVIVVWESDINENGYNINNWVKGI